MNSNLKVEKKIGCKSYKFYFSCKLESILEVKVTTPLKNSESKHANVSVWSHFLPLIIVNPNIHLVFKINFCLIEFEVNFIHVQLFLLSKNV